MWNRSTGITLSSGHRPRQVAASPSPVLQPPTPPHTPACRVAGALALFCSGAGWCEGQLHLFDADTGSLLHTFLNPTPAEGDAFGGSIAISGDKVLIGAWGDDTRAENSGAA